MHGVIATIVLAAGLASTAVARPPNLQAATLIAPAQPEDTRGESHAVRGIVKTFSTQALTITRASRRADLLTFVLNASTERAGTIAVGALVSVRYRFDGDTRVATAVTARDDSSRWRHALAPSGSNRYPTQGSVSR